ncbi:MAG: VacJ family lipoprotein [Kordiimonadaceae bacterium]|nr:VacJ family lipoprotein [Kordiimonadaceae bacterium]
MFLTACAGVPVNTTLDAHRFSSDPEKLNRAIYQFNTVVDKSILRPVAQGYRAVTPAPARKGISNIFKNLLEINSLLNNILQGDLGGAGQNFSRFIINSTVGVLGLFDIASRNNIAPDIEDFGQTMAVWGIPHGPYLVLPFLGPSSLRDAIGLIPYYMYTQPESVISDFEARVAVSSLYIINQRAQLLGASDLLEGQLDPYSFLRESREQARINAIFDNKPPEEEFDNF